MIQKLKFINPSSLTWGLMNGSVKTLSSESPPHIFGQWKGFLRNIFIWSLAKPINNSQEIKIESG